MERVDIWLLTDNNDGDDLAKSLQTIGLKVNLVKGGDFSGCNIATSALNLFIVDLKSKNIGDIMSVVRGDSRLNNFIKFVFLKESDLQQALLFSNNMLHVEFISRPVNKREFVLLIEKSVVVETYRDVMKHVSREAEDRIEAYESLISIHKKDLFETEKEKEAFEKIIEFEKNFVQEQNKLNKAIKEFTMLRQHELFEMKNLLKAESMLEGLRRKELLDANDTIKAQEAALEFSSKELMIANKIIEATERTVEFSREEALSLHQKIKDLNSEVERLRVENSDLKNELQKVKK